MRHTRCLKSFGASCSNWQKYKWRKCKEYTNKPSPPSAIGRIAYRALRKLKFANTKKKGGSPKKKRNSKHLKTEKCKVANAEQHKEQRTTKGRKKSKKKERGIIYDTYSNTI